jgi:zinc transport system permease protein
MLDILSYPFMQRAIIGGLLVAYLASYYGVFIVQRGLSFLGSGLAHAAFGGVAIGILLQTEPLWISLPFTILVAIGITWIKERTKLGGDTAIGIFFSVSMAIGIIILSLQRTYSTSALTYLFGSILAVTWMDIIISGLMVLLSVALWPLWRRWAYSSFDQELAISDHLPVRRDDYVLSILIAITVVVAMKMVGIVLVAAFLVIPAAAARILSHTFHHMTLLSTAIGMVSAIIGLFVSYLLDIPSGPAIILIQALAFFIALVVHRR